MAVLQALILPSRPHERCLVFCALISVLMLMSICTQLCSVLVPCNSVHQDKHYILGSTSSKQHPEVTDIDFELLQRLAGEDMEKAVIDEQVASLLSEGWKPSISDRFWDLVLGRDEEERLEAARVKLARQGNHVMPIALSSVWEAKRWQQVTDALRTWAAGRFLHEPDILASLLRSVKEPIDVYRLNRYGNPGAELTVNSDGGLVAKRITDGTTSSNGDMQSANAEIFNKGIELGNAYQSCAVVGNSGILLNMGRNYSSLIDSHHAVIRLNHAPTNGFQQFVGRKTTLAFVNSHILHACAGAGAGAVSSRRCSNCQPYGDDIPTLMYICQPVHFLDVVRCHKSAMKAPLFVTDSRLDALCARIAKFYSMKGFVETNGRLEMQKWSGLHGRKFFHYSTGLQAVVVALGICERVSLFGFGQSLNAAHHYHTQQKHENPIHDYAAEYRFYLDLQNHKSRLAMPFLSQSGLPLPPLQILS